MPCPSARGDVRVLQPGTACRAPTLERYAADEDEVCVGGAFSRADGGFGVGRAGLEVFVREVVDGDAGEERSDLGDECGIARDEFGGDDDAFDLEFGGDGAGDGEHRGEAGGDGEVDALDVGRDGETGVG